MTKEVIDYINEANNVYIVAHIRPDGDAIGSAYALCLGLRNMGKNAHVIMSSYSKKFEFLEEVKDSVANVFEPEYDLLICTDCSDKARLDMLPEDFAKAKNVVVFDHHKFSSVPSNASIIEEETPACCEVVYKFFKDNNIEITPKMASYIYMGIMTDTGSFNYERTTSFSYKIAAEMIDKGADFVTICKKINDTMPESKVKLMTYVLQNMEVYFEGKLRISVVTQNVLDEFGVDKEDAEGMTNYLRGIEGTMLAVYIREVEGGKFKASLRSEGNIDCSVIAHELGGGGHIRAAGFDLIDVEKTKQELIKKMEEVL